MFDDARSFFAQPPVLPTLTVEALWNDRAAMEFWLKDVLFAEVLKLDWNGQKRRIDVAPIRLPFNEPYLLSLDLMSLISHRPARASVKVQDFQRMFCFAFIDIVAIPEHQEGTERDEEGGALTAYEPLYREEPQDFLRWLSSAMLRCAHGPYGDRRASLNPGLLSELLVAEAADDPVIRERMLSASVETIPLIVSTLFALHARALWPILRETLESRGLNRLKLHFSIMELFINRLADEELRYRTVEHQDIMGIFMSRDDGAYTDPRLDPVLEEVLKALEIEAAIEPAPPSDRNTLEVERPPLTRTSENLQTNSSVSPRRRDWTARMLPVEKLRRTG